jgi:dephospho-CoA kinase
MLKVGLTGSIGSGKSTVARLFKDYGFKIIDADLIVRGLLNKGNEGYKKVLEYFGSEVLSDNQEIDRVKLASIVFSVKEKRLLLNSIIHPLVHKRIIEILESYENKTQAVVLEIPLLAELLNGKRPKELPYGIQKIVVVDCPEKLCLKRLVELRNMSYEDAYGRLKAQASREKRLAIADYVINNSNGLSALALQVEKLANELKQLASL